MPVIGTDLVNKSIVWYGETYWFYDYVTSCLLGFNLFKLLFAGRNMGAGLKQSQLDLNSIT